MEKKSPFVVIFIVGILGVLFALMFFVPLFFNKSSDIEIDSDIDTNKNNTTESISVIHQYKNGIHKYKGKLLLPTPCHELGVRVVSSGLSSDQVTLSFEMTNTSNGCEQTITQQTFLVSFIANEKALVDAKINDQYVNLDITEIPDNQTFDDL